MSSLIRSRSECWRLPVLLCALWVLAPRPAAGAEPAEEAKAQARVKFNDGNVAYEQGDFHKALESFEAAYELVPLSGFLFNVAQCHRHLGDFARAASSYRRYLALSEKEPANAAMVKELIAEMDAKAKQQTASRAAPKKSVAQAKAMAKDRPETYPARPAEAQGGVKKEGGGLKEAEQRALEIRRSRSPTVKQKSLPPAAVPGTSVQEEREPLTRKWWVWAGAGAAAVVAGGIIYAVTAPDPRPTTLGTIPGR
jgi:tetratricopeptide (TPR) repeat protein